MCVIVSPLLHGSGTALLQVAIGATCVMFALLWQRAMARVRRNVCERAAAQRHIADTQSLLSLDRAVSTLRGVMRMQALVRAHQAETLRRRMEAMEAYVCTPVPCLWVRPIFCMPLPHPPPSFCVDNLATCFPRVFHFTTAGLRRPLPFATTCCGC